MISTFVVPLVVLGIIIVFHELGHFLVAKFFRIKVETFSVGFGPRLFGFRYGETDYRLSMFPLGGYVKMTDGVISNPKWQRFLVAAGGPAMNFVLAVALLTGLFMSGTNFSDAFAKALQRTIEDGALIVRALGELVTGQASIRSLDGPLSIMRATRDFYQAGFSPLIALMSMISLNLGLMNLLPIPLLDGGLMFMLGIECLMGRDLSLRMKERVVQVGLVFLLTLMVFVLYNDVMKLKI
jgi:regulator of sigma E protease